MCILFKHTHVRTGKKRTKETTAEWNRRNLLYIHVKKSGVSSTCLRTSNTVLQNLESFESYSSEYQPVLLFYVLDILHFCYWTQIMYKY